ncbi:thioredoxin domain-containing protein [Ditylenchus destructor]|uniref:Peptide-N(4)-(N-acetyl-beta-glucosaminyl)asparagine amidase n=1 Tax=Ditylenchus destructor TaxID=166010 RepID=A0AAD4N8M8_9BILA|nr:thioredoxin domain-containing protein [Ditylenchus destructor]
MVVHHIDQDSQFEEALQKAGATQLVVCDFFADWCGPCRFIAPVFDQLSATYPTAMFLKVNVDTCRGVCMTYGIRAMPTFIVLLNRNELGRIQGANATDLERLISSNIASSSGPKINKETAATPEERVWLERIVSSTQQTLAVSIMPLEQLKTAAITDGRVNQYELAKQLLQWFKESFFEWVNKPNCESCGKKAVPANNCNNVVCTPEEKSDGANRVEIYSCTDCNIEVRFPRYNNPGKLLETRRGRCGEWANCFALCCRAAGLETRWVNDSLDHVWVEIWSDDLQRWVHCDPCENVIDTPLMYDKGWRKKYSYVFAFGRDHVRDVTWRYCFDHAAAIKRRTSCREAVLRNFLTKLNIRLSKDQSPERQQWLTKIYMKELVEFLSPTNQLRDGSEAENQGRKSGAEEWRKERGELGQGSTNAKFTPTVIKPSEKEIMTKCFILKYNCVKDEYTRPSDSDSNPVVGWQKLLYETNEIFRKIERDWKMTYFCRKENSKAAGSLSWKVDLSECGQVASIEVNLGKLETFNGQGNMRAIVCCGDMCNVVPLDSGRVVLEEPGPAEYVEVRVDFMVNNESDSNSWQKAQLFRTGNENPTDNMIIQIMLK